MLWDSEKKCNAVPMPLMTCWGYQGAPGWHIALRVPRWSLSRVRKVLRSWWGSLQKRFQCRSVWVNNLLLEWLRMKKHDLCFLLGLKCSALNTLLQTQLGNFVQISFSFRLPMETRGWLKYQNLLTHGFCPLNKGSKWHTRQAIGSAARLIASSVFKSAHSLCMAVQVLMWVSFQCLSLHHHII